MRRGAPPEHADACRVDGGCTMVIRALVASDARLFREGLDRILRDVERVKLVGAATCARDAAERVHQLRPDVVLLDMSMDDAFSTARQVARACRSTRVIALGMPESEAEVLACAEIGVAGYVTREGSLTDVIAAIDAAARGEVRCSPRIAGLLLRRVASLADRHNGAFAPLTTREAQVLRLLQQGLSNKMISRRLGIELPTVKNHVHSILGKLGVHRRAEAVSLLHRRGRMQIDPSAAQN